MAQKQNKTKKRKGKEKMRMTIEIRASRFYSEVGPLLGVFSLKITGSTVAFRTDQS